MNQQAEVGFPVPVSIELDGGLVVALEQGASQQGGQAHAQGVVTRWDAGMIVCPRDLPCISIGPPQVDGFFVSVDPREVLPGIGVALLEIRGDAVKPRFKVVTVPLLLGLGKGVVPVQRQCKGIRDGHAHERSRDGIFKVGREQRPVLGGEVGSRFSERMNPA